MGALHTGSSPRRGAGSAIRGAAVNGGARGRNVGAVSFIAWLGAAPVAAGTLVAALATGCGGAAPPSGGGRPGATTLRVVNRIDGPCELVGVALGVGAQTVRLSPAPPRGVEPAVVAEILLAPGEHVVAARASARCPSGGVEPDTVVVGTQQVLRLERPAVITADLASRPGAGAGEPRIAVRLSAQGGVLVPESGVADREQVCVGVRSTRKALCRAEADLALATARKDVAWALCVRDQLGELRTAADLYDAVQARADEEAQALAAARVGALAGRVERCASGAAPDDASPLTIRSP